MSRLLEGPLPLSALELVEALEEYVPEVRNSQRMDSIDLHRKLAKRELVLWLKDQYVPSKDS